MLPPHIIRRRHTPVAVVAGIIAAVASTANAEAPPDDFLERFCNISRAIHEAAPGGFEAIRDEQIGYEEYSIAGLPGKMGARERYTLFAKLRVNDQETVRYVDLSVAQVAPDRRSGGFEQNLAIVETVKRCSAAEIAGITADIQERANRVRVVIAFVNGTCVKLDSGIPPGRLTKLRYYAPYDQDDLDAYRIGSDCEEAKLN